MPKRKRDEDAPAKATKDADPTEYQRAKLEEQITKGRKDFNRAVKLAKGFVRQRLGKRQREAQGKQDAGALQKINSEIEVLKVLRDPKARISKYFRTNLGHLLLDS
jgi:BUD22